MIIDSFNVRSLEGSINKRKARELVRDLHLDFIIIQEVKLSQVRETLCIIYEVDFFVIGVFDQLRALVGVRFRFGVK